MNENEIRFFETSALFREWLRKNHRTAPELHVGFLKVHTFKGGKATGAGRKGGATGQRSLTWPESVAEALCFGWIDGVRRRLDAERYVIRFTPRRKGSKWSAVNIRLVAELEAAGRMMEAGRAAFEARRHKQGPLAKGYSYEKREGSFDAPRLREFRKHAAAWAFFEAQPAGYRKKLTWWVMSAKQEETRGRRLERLVAASAAGKRLV